MAWELPVRRGRARVLYDALALGIALSGCAGGDSHEQLSTADGVLERARATFELRDGERTLAALRPVTELRSPLAQVELAADAAGLNFVREMASGVSVGWKLEQAAPVALLAVTGSRGWSVYPAGGPWGADLLQRISRDGTEDFLVFAHKPEREEVRYRLDVSAAAGLRFVAGTLEFLDAGGVPRLRMAAPWLLGADGALVLADVQIEGCAVDTSPAAPWQRPLTPPRADECLVRVAWGAAPDAAVRYPALLDPAWTSTNGIMTTTRTAHTATRLGDGRVLIAGGQHPSGASTVFLSTAELFDPATATFAATGSMAEGRSFHVAERLGDGRVVVAGGQIAGSGAAASAEIYDPTSGLWTATRPLGTARRRAASAALGNGKLLVAGGISTTSEVLSTSELFDPSGAGNWSAAGDMAFRRHGHTLSVLANGRVLVAAGITTLSVSDLQQAELFEPLTNVWSPTGLLGTARYYHAAAVLTSGQVLVAAGYSRGISANTSSAERFSPTTGTWSSAASVAQRRQHHTLTALPSGAALLVGGVLTSGGTTPSQYFSSAELYDATRNSWGSAGALSESRYWHTATLLADGRVLVAGGDGPLGPSSSAELFDLDALGSACAAAASCKSGFCVDGVCCESECASACQACSAALTGQTNGTCAPVAAGTDPNNDCRDDGSPACAKNGLCDGAGNCQNYASSSCTPRPCTQGSECTSNRCYDGVCCDALCTSTCRACTAAKKGFGLDGICEPIADGSDPDGECQAQGTGVCAADGVCNGSGQCRLPTAGTECGPVECADDTLLRAAVVCSASGTCPTATTTSCSPYRCDPVAKACKLTCAGDGDCVPGLQCVSGACQLKPDGAVCTTRAQCQSGNCADGICCNRACTGQCEACDLAGSVGSCSAVTGSPHGARPPCGGSPGAPCTGECNGVDRVGCSYPDTNTACGEVTCADGKETAQRCNGSGECGIASTQDCAPYACGEGACKTSCETDADCAAGAGLCHPTGECVASSTPFCADEATLRGPGDEVTPCHPFKCQNDRCDTQCATSEDCASGAICYPRINICGPPESAEDEGCGCRTAKARQNAPAGLLLWAFGLALGLRRIGRRGGVKR